LIEINEAENDGRLAARPSFGALPAEQHNAT
jgi:hypothetical protein